MYKKYQSFKDFILQEDFIGNNILFYHRTGLGGVQRFEKSKVLEPNEFVKMLNKNGLKPGYGDKVGRGIYGFHNLEHALHPSASHNYGNIILKCQTRLNRILILDEKHAKKVYKTNYSIKDQLKMMGIEVTEQISKIIDSYDFNDLLTDTYDLGHELYSYLPKNSITGISYFSGNDGECVTIYEPDSINILSYNTTFNDNKKLDNDDWIKIKNKESVKRALQKNIKLENSPYKNPEDLISKFKKNEVDVNKIDDKGIEILLNDSEYILGVYKNPPEELQIKGITKWKDRGLKQLLYHNKLSKKVQLFAVELLGKDAIEIMIDFGRGDEIPESVYMAAIKKDPDTIDIIDFSINMDYLNKDDVPDKIKKLLPSKDKND